MKWISALTLLLLAVAGQAATFVWEPSAVSSNAPLTQLYRVYSSPVVSQAAAVWTVYGETTQTNLFITNNVFRMFRVNAVANSVESDPSNAATNTFAKPNPPGGAVISASIDSAPTPSGPWQQETNMNFTVKLPPEATNQFFRSRMAIALR